jgi:predicted signal transduction protein with EAL and GGDEF domain
MGARVGGDEFAVLVFDTKPGAAQHVARRIIESFTEPFDLFGQRVTVSASVGLAAGLMTPDELLRSADVAMYRAKAAGKGRLALFEPGMDHDASERLALHADLAEAVTGGQLRLLYQPVVDLADGSLRGAEALVRWQHPTLGLLTPDRFIGLAEDTGLIGALGRWVLHEACREAAGWSTDVAIAVNLSPRQLDDPAIVREVADILDASGLHPARLILEITESVLAHDVDAMIPRLEALRALGVRIAVDDFGTGYSSLSALVHLPVDILKIDRVFIARMLERTAAADLVQVLIDMGGTLGLEVIAEGIEQTDQVLALRAQHCRFGQGYLFSRPVPATELVRLLDLPAKATPTR